ncbi:MAG: cysteate racemase [Caulobacteraceae bacterium]
MTRKVLGVLGGMGPAATVDFLAKLQAATPAKADEDHIRVIADINPRVPNRHNDAENAGRELARMAVALREAGAEVIAMPCNSAHAHAATIRAASGLPFIDILDEAIAAARATGAVRIGVLATPVALGLYKARLEAAGLEAMLPDADAEAAFMAVIYRIKAGDLGPQSKAAMKRLAHPLIAAGAQALIAGCTEVPLVLHPGDVDVPLIDSSQTLAERCVAVCGGDALPGTSPSMGEVARTR